MALPACRSWRPAASPCASRASRCTACRRWRARPRRRGSPPRRRLASPPCSCSSSARRRPWASSSSHDEDAPIVADICRKLDGVPLAIEFAAARIDAFGVRGLAAHLDDRLQLLTGGRRPALPRHHSLRANLDWGHDLLREPERVVLRRVAIFAGGFTLGAAKAVAASAEIAAPEVVECVANLVTKSLIAADVDGAVPRYRLLETTQAYALEKLSESGELEQVERRHGRILAEPGLAARGRPGHDA